MWNRNGVYDDEDKKFVDSLKNNISSPDTFAGNIVNNQHSLKCVLIEGYYPESGGNFEITHGLSENVVVVGVQGGFSYSGDEDSRQLMPPNFTHSSNFEYQMYVNIAGLSFRDISASNLYGRRGEFLITYY